MDFNVYTALIAASVVVLLSYFYNALAGRTNIPSVLMLIVTGFIFSLFIEFNGKDLRPVLEILGTVGLVMIVLEAALDLKLEKSKAGLLMKSLVIALILLLLTTFGIALIIRFFYTVDRFEAIIYAIPLSIMSSAIIIPSVNKLVDEKKEFLIVEAAFSDILGIMLFYFILDTIDLDGVGTVSLHIVQNLGLTLVIAVAFGYLIIILIQKVTSEVKLFLPIAVLVLLYATGKLFHLSSLIFVLVFGLMLNNIKLFFRGFLKPYIIPEAYKELLSEIKLITLESSFLIRTFFFIAFGMSITLDGFNQISVFVVSFLALAVMFVLRWGAFKLIAPKQMLPGIYVAARGLITILLFYSIPVEHQITGFSPAVLFLIIIISNLIMMYGLIRNTDEPDQVVEAVDESKIDELMEQPFDDSQDGFDQKPD